MRYAHQPPTTSYRKGVTINTPEDGEIFNAGALFDITGTVLSPAQIIDLTVQYIDVQVSTFPSGPADAYEAVNVSAVASEGGGTITVTADYADGTSVIATRYITVIAA